MQIILRCLSSLFLSANKHTFNASRECLAKPDDTKCAHMNTGDMRYSILNLKSLTFVTLEYYCLNDELFGLCSRTTHTKAYAMHKAHSTRVRVFEWHRAGEVAFVTRLHISLFYVLFICISNLFIFYIVNSNLKHCLSLAVLF